MILSDNDMSCLFYSAVYDLYLRHFIISGISVYLAFLILYMIPCGKCSKDV